MNSAVDGLRFVLGFAFASPLVAAWKFKPDEPCRTIFDGDDLGRGSEFRRIRKLEREANDEDNFDLLRLLCCLAVVVADFLRFGFFLFADFLALAAAVVTVTGVFERVRGRVSGRKESEESEGLLKAFIAEAEVVLTFSTTAITASPFPPTSAIATPEEDGCGCNCIASMI